MMYPLSHYNFYFSKQKNIHMKRACLEGHVCSYESLACASFPEEIPFPFFSLLTGASGLLEGLVKPDLTHTRSLSTVTQWLIVGLKGSG